MQKPLAAPDLAAVVPARSLGQTFAQVTGDVVVEASSTARVQLLARWTDPTDNPAEPAPGAQTQTAHPARGKATCPFPSRWRLACSA